tara:strand:- start:1800 stop:1961 length:162 start_codon:yes stop_codon:yes gene_type:complete
MYVETKETALLGDPAEIGRLLQSLLLMNPEQEFIVWRRGDMILIRHDWGMRVE